MNQNVKEIAIIGMGLIGGSIALALKKGGYQGKIIGSDVSIASLEEAKRLGAIDFLISSPQEAVKNADLIVVAVPLGYYKDLFNAIGPSIKKNTIVTDVGSVKGYVSEIAGIALPKDIQFIGGHPMAGSDKSGINAASGIMFENAYYFITPEISTTEETIRVLKEFIGLLKAYPVVITPFEHDKVVAQISHLPHLLAVLLVNMLDTNKGISYLPFVGGGFRDSTRIAAGSPEIWKDIFLYNKQEIIEKINIFEGMISQYKTLLNSHEEASLQMALNKAKLIRNSIPQHSANYMPPLYEIIIGVEDRPGILGELTSLIGENNLNIKEIEILHSREGEEGAIRIGFEKANEVEKAVTILVASNYKITYRKGAGKDVNCE